MKNIYILSFLFMFTFAGVEAQQNTTVRANSIDISDNLDLRAVATLFGESADLEDFERKLNDPEIKISNLDLNQDNQVDYLRVVEILENNQHLIVIQSVIGQDLFQDIATIEVEKEVSTQRVQVQVVGNSYFYGAHYVYEPVFVTRPIIFNYFWRPYYVAYYSPWYWGYYPTYYYGWNPYPIYTYRNHIGFYVNRNNFCHYRPSYRSHYYYSNHYRNTRFNAYERQYPNRSFTNRNQGYANRSELNNGRENQSAQATGRTQMNGRTENGTRNPSANRSQTSQRVDVNSRTQTATTVQSNRSTLNTRTQTGATIQNNRSTVNTRTQAQTSSRAQVVSNNVTTRNPSSVVGNQNASGVQTVGTRSTQNSVQNSAQPSTILQNRSQRSISQNSAPARTQVAPQSQPTRAATSSSMSSSRGSGATSRSAGGRG